MVPVILFGKEIFSSKTLHKEEILQKIISDTNFESEDFYLLQNGKLVNDNPINNAFPVHIQLRILGGKGGFGSMLRAIGAQIEKTTNREACRDLSGRRLRDINEEKRLKAWLEKQKDRENEAEEKKKRKIEKLLHVPKHEFKDAQYEEARSKLTEKVSDAVEKGFKKAVEKQTDKPNLKRKAEPAAKVNNKKSALWIGADIDGSSSSDSEDSEDSNKNIETDNAPSISSKNH